MSKNKKPEIPLSAPYVDTLIFRAERCHMILDDSTKTITMDLFKKLHSIAVCGGDERRELWLRAPRGSIDDFACYEEYLEDGEIDNLKEFEDLWLLEYPEPQKWYKLTTVEYNGLFSIIIDGKLVMQYDPNPQQEYPYDKSELANWILAAVDDALSLLKMGDYNKYLNENLPFRKRIGKILREDYWHIFPQEKEWLLNDIEPNEILRFRNLIKEQPNNAPLSRLESMTSGLFFNCCRLGYEANQYKNIENLTSKQMYINNADGRDEGLLDLDDSSTEAFELWYYDKNRYGGHPWEVCRGGNSTHVSLYVHHDEKGWWLSLAGINRLAETVKFYLALSDNGIPIFLRNSTEIADMLIGKDYIGIVPEGVIPRYCDYLFPEEKILTFMNLPLEESNVIEKSVIWYPIRESRLV